METPEQYVKFVQRYQNDAIDIVLLFLFLGLNRFHTLFWCLHR